MCCHHPPTRVAVEGAQEGEVAGEVGGLAPLVGVPVVKLTLRLRRLTLRGLQAEQISQVLQGGSKPRLV